MSDLENFFPPQSHTELLDHTHQKLHQQIMQLPPSQTKADLIVYLHRVKKLLEELP